LDWKELVGLEEKGWIGRNRLDWKKKVGSEGIGWIRRDRLG